MIRFDCFFYMGAYAIVSEDTDLAPYIDWGCSLIYDFNEETEEEFTFLVLCPQNNPDFSIVLDNNDDEGHFPLLHSSDTYLEMFKKTYPEFSEVKFGFVHMTNTVGIYKGKVELFDNGDL